VWLVLQALATGLSVMRFFTLTSVGGESFFSQRVLQSCNEALNFGNSGAVRLCGSGSDGSSPNHEGGKFSSPSLKFLISLKEGGLQKPQTYKISG
jgi:hypothetical protein